ncbi:MAG TPA: hypothetical protein VKY74_01885 [Chloroflexia bacterium]|nr:hypothetical protein [Chloroflexia bacterium]
MENLSTTQLDELERQYNEQDRKDWNMTAESYGWTHEQADEVWNWFNQRPVAGPPGTPGEVH